MSELLKKVEAILFAVGRAISEREISELAEASVSDVHHALVELKKQYESRESPLLVIEQGDSWKLTVHEKHLRVVQKINPHTELGKSILETLAVIAWKQPATQSEIIKIRTNKAYEHIEELEKQGFIAKVKHGRTFLLKVTGKFFDYFDLPGDKGVREIFKDVKDVGEAQSKLIEHEGTDIGLDTYGVKDEVRLEKEKKAHVGDLEVFEDVEEHKKEEPEEIDSFLKENKTKPAPQEEELVEEEKEEISEESEERALSPELEEMIKDKKKKKE